MNGSRIPPKIIFIIGAFIAFSIAFIFFSELVGNAKTGLELLVSLFSGRRMVINSSDMLEKAMLCLHERAISCENVEKGDVWKPLKGTVLENCPCGNNFVAGTEIFSNLNLKNEKFIELKDGFAGFQYVRKVDFSCRSKVEDNVLKKMFLGLFGNLRSFLLVYDKKGELEENNIKLLNESKILFVVNKFGNYIQGCIEIRG